MSTKMLRKIIEAHRALGPDVRGTPTHELHQALDEVEAIEKAARTIKDVKITLATPNPMETAAAYDLMERIAAQRSGGTTGGLNDGLSGVRFGAGVTRVGANGEHE